MIRFITIVILILLFFDETTAEIVEEKCQRRIAQYSSPSWSPTACISIGDSVRTELAEGDYVIFVKDHGDISMPDSLKLDMAKSRFVLVVDGICAGDCSLLLMPLARGTSFLPDSFSVLTKSSVPSRFRYLGKSMFGNQKMPNQIALKDFSKAEKEYVNFVNSKINVDYKLISTTRTNLTHLTWHSHVQQDIYRSGPIRCRPLKSLGVVLTDEYFKENSMLILGEYKFPSKKVILEKMAQRFKDDYVLANPFSNTLLEKCRKKPTIVPADF